MYRVCSDTCGSWYNKTIKVKKSQDDAVYCITLYTCSIASGGCHLGLFGRKNFKFNSSATLRSNHHYWEISCGLNHTLVCVQTSTVQ